MEILDKQKGRTELELFTAVSTYFYENKEFYRKALKIEGQNSFSEHFREVMLQFISEIYKDKELNSFQLELFTDIIILAFHKLIIEETNISANEFVNNIKDMQKKIEKC